MTLQLESSRVEGFKAASGSPVAKPPSWRRSAPQGMKESSTRLCLPEVGAAEVGPAEVVIIQFPSRLLTSRLSFSRLCLLF